MTGLFEGMDDFTAERNTQRDFKFEDDIVGKLLRATGDFDETEFAAHRRSACAETGHAFTCAWLNENFPALLSWKVACRRNTVFDPVELLKNPYKTPTMREFNSICEDFAEEATLLVIQHHRLFRNCWAVYHPKRRASGQPPRGEAVIHTHDEGDRLVVIQRFDSFLPLVNPHGGRSG